MGQYHEFLAISVLTLPCMQCAQVIDDSFIHHTHTHRHRNTHAHRQNVLMHLHAHI